MIKRMFFFTNLFLLFLITACNNTNDTYTIGGTLSGLLGTLVLQNNESDYLTLSSDGDFIFATALNNADGYEVTVKTQPDGQICTVENGTGTISDSNITDIIVSCSTNTYSLDVTVNNLEGIIILQNNNGDDLTINEDGTFSFDTEVNDGANYSITISDQPESANCVLSNATGTVDGEDITNITVTCYSDSTIFISNTTTDGNIGGAEGADTICNADANKPDDGKTYKALIVDDTRIACTSANCSGGISENTDWVMTPYTRYYRTDGTTLIGTTTESGIFAAPLDNAFNETEIISWTGIAQNWTNSYQCATNWSSNNSGWHANVGHNEFTDANSWSKTYGMNPACDTAYHLICVSQQN